MKNLFTFSSLSLENGSRKLFSIFVLLLFVGVGNVLGTNYIQMTPGTDALSNGDEVLIAIEDRKAGKFYFVQCGSTKHVEQTVSAGVVSNPAAATVWKVTASESLWIFRKNGAASNGYLYNNDNTTLNTDNSSSTTWYVTNGTSSGYKYFKIQRNNSSGRYISWNAAKTPTFGAYANTNWSVQASDENISGGNGALQIFKKQSCTSLASINGSFF